jgi:hypothetical protein
MESMLSVNFDTSFLKEGYYCISPLGSMKEVTCYVYYDGPQIFTCRHKDGYMMLAVNIHEEESKDGWQTWYLMKHVSKEHMDTIESGEIGLRDVFKGHSVVSLYDHNSDKHIGSWCVPTSKIPDKYLPSESARLNFWEIR